MNTVPSSTGSDGPQVHGPGIDRFALTALLAIAAMLCVLTWRRWGSLTVDCGHEMYVPAALNEGKRLYLDAWYPYGPLIPYWHALLFRLFGVHLGILETAGIVIVGVMTSMIYLLSRIFLPVALSFVGAFAFIVQAFQLNLFNYVLPYSYPAAYGAMLFTILVFLVVKDSLNQKSWTIFAAGSLAGLEALTKIEFGLAAYIVTGLAILLRALRSRSFARLIKDAAYCIPGLLLFVGVYGSFIRAGSVDLIFRQNIPILPDSYLYTSGIESRWARSIGFTTSPATIAVWAVLGLLGVCFVAASVRLANASLTARRLLVAAGVAIGFFHLAATSALKILHWPIPSLLTDVAPFFYFNRGMVFVAMALSISVLFQWRKRGLGQRDSAMLLLAAAAIAVGFRTLVGIHPTGFAIFYDTIAFIAFLIALWEISRVLGTPRSARLWAGTSALLCWGLISLTASYYPIPRRSFLISLPRGSLYTDPSNGQAFMETLAFLNQAKAHSEKFVVWPEEAALYYFSGTTAPTRWDHLTPGLLPVGELTSQFLNDLDRLQVKYVALSNRATPEYGASIFGIDYNQQPYRWLQQNFRVVRTFGDFQRVDYPPHWAVQIWEREPANE